MTEGGGGIKGISIGVTADASQVKRVFQEAIQGFEGKTVNITLEAREGKSFQTVMGRLRGQKIEVDLVLKPTRQAIRDFRKNINDNVEKQGGIRVPIMPKGLNQREGRDVRQAIERSIGTPKVDVILNWKWGPNGPPPSGFTGTMGIGGGGGGSPGAASPFVPSGNQQAATKAQMDAYIRNEVSRRMAAQGAGGTANTGTGSGSWSRARQAPPEPPETTTDPGAVGADRKQRKPRKPHRFDRMEAEGEEQWRARLLEARADFLKKLESKSENVRRRANNNLVGLDRRLGIDEGRVYEDTPGKSVRREGKTTVIAPVRPKDPLRVPEPELSPKQQEKLRKAERAEAEVARRLGEARAIARGSTRPRRVKDLGPDEMQEVIAARSAYVEQGGPQMTGGRFLSRVFEPQRIRGVKAAQESIPGILEELSAARAKVDALRPKPGGGLVSDIIREARRTGELPPTGSPSRERAQAFDKAGFRFGAEGVEDLGLYGQGMTAQQMNRMMERINDRVFGLDAPGPQGGFRGGGRAQRSMYSEGGKGIDRAMQEVAPRGPSELISSGKVAAGRFVDAFIEEVHDETVKRPDWRQDKAVMEEFKNAPQTVAQRWGEAFEKASALMAKGETSRALFGDRKWNQETERWDLEEGGFEGAVPARANLLAAARARKIPGVSTAAVRYAMAPTRDDMPSGKMSEAGLNFISKFDALTAIIQEAGQVRAEAALVDKRQGARQQGAETLAEALNPPVREKLGTPIIAPRGRGPGARPGTTKFTESKADYESRVEVTMAEHRARQREISEQHAQAMARFNERVKARQQSRLNYVAPAGEFSWMRDRPQGAAPEMPAPSVQPDMPDFSAIADEMGIGVDRILEAFSGAGDIAMAAGGAMPPGAVPPGFVAQGGGQEWSGGVVPVRVTNWPSGLSGEATGPSAASGVDVPKAPGPKGQPQTLAEAMEETVAKVADKTGKAKKAAPEPPLGAAARTFGRDVGNRDLEKAARAVDNVSFNLAQQRKKPGADLENVLKGAVAANTRLADLLEPAGGGAANREAATRLGSELQGIQMQKEQQRAAAAAARAAGTQPGVEPTGRATTVAGALAARSRFGLPPLSAERLAEIQRNAGMMPGRGRGDDPTTRGLLDSMERARVGVEVSPARAVATATGQIFSNLPFIGGRSGMLDRARKAQELSSEALGLKEKRDADQAALDITRQSVTEVKAGSKAHKELSATIVAQTEKVKASSAAYETAAKAATDANKSVARASDIVRSFGAGVLGTITGQILFQGVLGAAQGLVQAGTAALGPVVERSGGYQTGTARITTEAAAATMAGAPSETVVAQQLAAANMTREAAEGIEKALADRAQIMAGNQQIAAQTSLQAAGFNVDMQNARSMGPRGGGRTRWGEDINLYESTGGILNTSFGAPGMSTQEALGQLFSEAGRQRKSSMARLSAIANPINQPGAFEGEFRAIGVAPEGAMVRAPNNGRSGGGEGSIWGALFGPAGPSQPSPGVGPSARVPGLLKDFEGALRASNSALSIHAATTEADKEKVEEFAAALDRADMQEFAGGVRNAGFYIRGLEGMSDVQQEKVLTAAAENYARGVARRDPAQLMAGMADQISAAVQSSVENARIERELSIPAQRDLAALAAPALPFSETSILGSPRGGASDVDVAAGGTREGVMPGARAAVQRAAQSTLRLQGRRSENEAQAMTAYDELFKPLGDEVKAEFMDVRQDIKSVGLELAQLGNEQVDIQVNLSMQQFEEQLRQVRRGLADARELTTGVDQGGNNDNLGLLQRTALMQSRASAQLGFQQQALGIQSQQIQYQNALLGRRSQLLSFQSTELGFQSKQLGFMSTALSLAQNQRQINFSVASAGFTAPGTTPEERAARIAEAKAEAAYQQQQQDIAVKQFDIEKQGFGIEQQQYAIAQQQFALDAAQLEIQRQNIGLAQQQYALGVASWQTQQAIIDAQNARAVEDLEIQERLIGAAMTATQQLAANEKTISNLRSELEALQQKAGSYLQQATGVTSAIAQAGTALIAQFGGDLGTMVTAYANAWISFRQRVTQSDSEWYSQNPETRYGGGRTGDYTYNAPGAMGMVSAPTKMVVGDAGGEMVAILRNPRPVAAGIAGMGGGGGFTQVNVTVTGNTVRNDDDLERLATLVGRRVEQEMGRKARMLGFGPGR